MTFPPKPERQLWSQTTETTAPEEVVESAAPTAEPKPTADEPWYERRIRQLTAQKRAAEEELATVKGAKPPVVESEPAPKALGVPKEDVETRAAQIVAEREFNQRCDEIWETGKGEFKDFGSKIENFQKLGGLTPAHIEAAIETGIPHKVLYELGANMDEGAKILAMPPVKMAVAMAKLADRLAKTKPISKVDEPIEPLTGGRSSTPRNVNPDELSLDKWMAWREKDLESKRR